MKKSLFLLFILPCSLFSQENNYISNKDYSEFVTYARDSLFRSTMAIEVSEEYATFEESSSGNWEISSLNWEMKLDINHYEAREPLEIWCYEPSERLNRKREFDTRKFVHNGVKVYPDELVWCRDSTINKSWGTFLSKYYFTHSYYKDYPVYGLTKQQIQEYIKWKYPKASKTFIATTNKNITLKLPKEKLQFTVGEYFEFYKYTRDSVVRMLLCQKVDEYKYCLSENEYSEEINPPLVKWKHQLNWNDERVVEVLRESGILTKNDSIDNRRIIYTYWLFDYYRATTIPDASKRSNSIIGASQNICHNKYINLTSSINIKKELKNKVGVRHSNIDTQQLKAYYYWKKISYPIKDVFDGFIPIEKDIKLLQEGNLTDEFYKFKVNIPLIQIE
tara:strand:+ start:167 stop:1339 length:1173 start_codon:yes stop_codon:yes gene_type:complete